MQTFPFSPPIHLAEDSNWLLAVTSFEATNSVYIFTDENKSFSISTLSHWSSRGGAETINKLQKLLELRSENDIELHVKELGKKEIK